MSAVTGQLLAGLLAAASLGTWVGETYLRPAGPLSASGNQIVAAAHRVGLKVVPGDHFNEGFNAPRTAQQANVLWHGSGGNTDGCHSLGTVTDQRFVEDWRTVTRHFKGESAVIGYDLLNEPLAYTSGMSTREPCSSNLTHTIRRRGRKISGHSGGA